MFRVSIVALGALGVTLAGALPSAAATVSIAFDSFDLDAADAAFEVARARTEAEPESWEAWYLLSFAYDAAGDRKRARSGLRRAAALFRSAAS